MRTYDLEHIGTRIRQMRMKQGITQTALAEQLGVSRVCITNWETHTRSVDVHYWEKLADIFGVSIETLCGAREDCHDALNLSHLPNQAKERLIEVYCDLLKENFEEQKAIK